jgi:hypothetical protein
MHTMRTAIRTSVPLLLALACAFALAPADPAIAQTVTGTLQGTVTDSSGAVLPGATVTIRNADTGGLREVVTNDVGFYSAPYLAIGRYTVTAKLDGFQTVVREGVQVSLNDTRVLNIEQKPASVAETVTVTGEAPRINSTNAEVKGVLTEDQIIDKPALNPGSFLNLAEIFPGFQENPTSGQNNPTASSGSSVNFNGTGSRGATFQINGVNNDDSSENQNRQGASLSTIKEFQVLSNTYSAEFGRGYGAVVLVQTKSGTNQWRGDAYWYLQDSNDLTALRKFATVKPDNQRNQYGGTLGFPIRKDRLFAFVSFDRTKYEGTQNYARDIILPSEIAKPWLTRGNDTAQNRSWISGILARYPQNVTPNDPRSNRTYATVQGFRYPDEDYSGRLDWQRGQDSVSARYQYTHQIRETDDIILGENARQDNDQQNLGVTWTRIFRNSLVGEFRYGLGIRSTNVNIAAGNNTPIVRFTASPVSGTILGNSGAYPINRDQLDHQFVYNLSWMLGSRHSLKAGTDIRRQALDDLADNFSRGFWTFNRVCGGTTYATPYDAFLDGCVASYQQAWGPFYLENRMNESNVYIEDQWRLSSAFTLSAGLRYEYVSAPEEVEGRLDYVYGDDRNNWEPRVAAAWSLPASDGFTGWITGRRDGDASLRGGYGRTDGRIFQSVFSQNGASVRTNPPDAILLTFTAQPNILNVGDPTLGYTFVPGPQTARHQEFWIDPELEMPKTDQWSVSYERQLPWDSSLRISYNGNHVSGTLRYVQGNLPLSPEYGSVLVVDHPNNAPTGTFPDLRGKYITAIAKDVQCAGTGYYGIALTTACPAAVPIADNEISQRVPRTNERRPDPRYSTNLIISNGAESWYDGLQIEWLKRLSMGFSFTANYTYSLSEDTTSEATFVGAGDSNQLGPDKRYAKGYSRFHTPHRFTLNGTYQVPFLKGRRDLVGSLLGGWQVSGVLKLASGTPFTVTQTGLDLNFDGFSEGRPVILDTSILGNSVDDPDKSTEQLPVTAFRQTTIFDTVDDIVGRNTFFGDGLVNVDLGIYKSFRVYRAQALSLRVQVFNLFNYVQYGFPTTDIANANFGKLLTTNGLYIPRTVQINVRYQF